VSKCSSNLTSRFSVGKRASRASQSLVPRFFAPRVLFFTSLSLAELLIFLQHSPLTVPHSHSSYQHCDSSILSSRTCTPLTACAAYSRHTLLFSSPFSPKRYLCSRWGTIHRGGQERLEVIGTGCIGTHRVHFGVTCTTKEYLSTD